jgi:hypothetical protein
VNALLAAEGGNEDFDPSVFKKSKKDKKPKEEPMGGDGDFDPAMFKKSKKKDKKRDEDGAEGDAADFDPRFVRISHSCEWYFIMCV